MRHSIPGALLAAVLAGNMPLPAQDFPSVAGEHALLVTVDDLPIGASSLHPDPAERERITRALLDVLAKHQVKAVGLVTWRNVTGPSDEALLQLWLDAGHELGNHTVRHLDYPRTRVEEYLADVEEGRARLSAFLERRGKKLRFFRFPFLREGDTPGKLEAMRDWLARTGQRNLPVTIDDQDWSFEKPWTEARRAGDQAKLARLAEDYQHALRLEVLMHTASGDALLERPTAQVLLLHANEVGAAQWDALFSWMERRGFRFASADEVLADPAYALPHAFLGRYGGTLWLRLEQERRVQEAEAAVRSLLDTMAADGSAGRLEAFSSAYAEDAVLLAGGAAFRGRPAIAERHRASLPEGSEGGRLTVEVMDLRPLWGPEVTPLGDAEPGRVHAMAAAVRWTLARPGQPPRVSQSGLVLRRDGKSWLIVQDAGS